MNLTRERRDEVIAKAQAIVDAAKAAGRGLTSAERTSIDGHLAEAKSINAALRGDEKSREVLAGLDGMSRGAKSSSIDDGRRLTFGAKMAGKVASNLLGGPDGNSKALAPSGATVVGLDFEADPIALGRVATNLLNVLPVIEHDSPAFSYLRQGFTGRTNNAAVVADGAVKPTSVYGVERVDAALSVVAHLSELINRYWLLDNVSLQQFLSDELQFGLALAIEAKVLADINATSGIQTQTYSTSALITIRKSVTKLEAAGLVPGSIVVSPAAWETVELALASTNALEHLSLPYEPSSRRLYGVPVVVTVSEAPLVCHVLASDAVALDTDTFGVQVDYSENSTADSFSRNQIQARCEGRFATSVYRPFGVVKAALV
jgi:HK97 family phage major capsid protein